jgi:adenosylmethionine-8-amino-7-oxononanoate aminotransferase
MSSLIIENSSWPAGLYSYSKDWWIRLQSICKQNDIIFIIDDIAFCGGKTGKFFGFESYIIPDIVCAGKALSGGYFPLSVCLISQQLYEVVKETRFMHGFSYTFSMSGIISALHYLNVLDKEKVYDQYDTIKYVADGMFNSLLDIPSVKDVRNYGLTWCIDLNIDNATNDYLVDLFFKNGLYLGLWNSPAVTKRVLIHIPNILDYEYFDNIKTRLTSVMKSL